MSEARSYYVYVLKDYRTKPPKPFYIGKGTGIRGWEHDLQVDASAKGERVRLNHEAGFTKLCTILVDELTQSEALRIEAQLIVAFGIESRGGMLTNVVVPSTTFGDRVPRNLSLPQGIFEKAQLGLRMLKEAVVELGTANPNGVTNADVAHTLGLHSDNNGKQKDYLSYSILGLLMRDGKLEKVGRRYRARGQ
jgi:hypothetical protein